MLAWLPRSLSVVVKLFLVKAEALWSLAVVGLRLLGGEGGEGGREGGGRRERGGEEREGGGRRVGGREGGEEREGGVRERGRKRGWERGNESGRKVKYMYKRRVDQKESS